METIWKAFIKTTKIKFTISLITAIFISSTGFSQKVDYEIMRESLELISCNPKGYQNVFQANLELRNIDTSIIDKNLDLYYSDLAWSYYVLYLYSKDNNLVGKSIENYKKADHHKPNVSKTYWQLSFLYFLQGDCIAGKYYLEKFKSVTDKEYWHKDQIKLITKDCEN